MNHPNNRCFVWTVIGCICLSLLACQSTDTEQAPPPSTTKGQAKVLEHNIFAEEEVSLPLSKRKHFLGVLDSTFYKQPRLLVQQLQQYYALQDTQHTTLLALERQVFGHQQDSMVLLCCQQQALQDSSCLHTMPTFYYLFNKKGQLLLQKKAVSARLLPVLKDSVALLLTVEQNCAGIGRYHLYDYVNGKFIDVLQSVLDPLPIMRDVDAKGGLFKKEQQKLVLQDVNKDSHLDMVFRGDWLLLEDDKGRKYYPWRPYKKEKKQYVFVYKPAKEAFFLQE